MLCAYNFPISSPAQRDYNNPSQVITRGPVSLFWKAPIYLTKPITLLSLWNLGVDQMLGGNPSLHMKHSLREGERSFPKEKFNQRAASSCWLFSLKSSGEIQRNETAIADGDMHEVWWEYREGTWKGQGDLKQSRKTSWRRLHLHQAKIDTKQMATGAMNQWISWPKSYNTYLCRT